LPHWLGALGYTDDLILLVPNRILQICEVYGGDHNLVFSTDPDPAKFKSKIALFCGKASRVRYPGKLQLDGKYLPWVETADHLGHTLHQETSMDKDCHRARASYIDTI
jgi:hypothetical protein